MAISGFATSEKRFVIFQTIWELVNSCLVVSRRKNLFKFDIVQLPIVITQDNLMS